MKPRWKIVKLRAYWQVEMKMNEDINATLLLGRRKAERGRSGRNGTTSGAMGELKSM